MGEAFLRSIPIVYRNHIDGSFSDILGLKNVSIIDFPGITEIQTSRFKYNYDITKIDLPNCSMIYSNAFYWCTNLSYVRLAAGKLMANAFAGCTNIDTFIIKGNSCIFEYYPLPYGGSKDRNVYLLTTELPISNIPISSTFGSMYASKIYVYESMYDNFVNDENWSTVSDRIYIYNGGEI